VVEGEAVTRDAQGSWVDNLSLRNKYGRVLWPGRSDISGFDFEKWVDIGPGWVEVYPDHLFSADHPKPKVGTKLNKTATLTFFGVQAASSNPEVFLRAIAARCAAQDCTFRHLGDQTGVLEVQVTHFTKFDFGGFVASHRPPQPSSQSQLEIEKEEDNSDKPSYQEISIHSRDHSSKRDASPSLERQKKRTKPSTKSFQQNLEAINQAMSVQEAPSPRPNAPRVSFATHFVQDLAPKETATPRSLHKVADLTQVGKRFSYRPANQSQGSGDDSEDDLDQANHLTTVLAGLDPRLREQIGKINAINRKKQFEALTNTSGGVKFPLLKDTFGFLWVGNFAVGVGGALFPQRLTTRTAIKPSIDGEFALTLQRTLESREVDLANDFRRHRLSSLNFIHVLTGLYNDFHTHGETVLFDDRFNLWAAIKLFLELFVCFELDADKIAASEALESLILEEEKASSEYRQKEKTRYGVRMRRKLYEWLGRMEQKRAQEAHESDVGRQVEEEGVWVGSGSHSVDRKSPNTVGAPPSFYQYLTDIMRLKSYETAPIERFIDATSQIRKETTMTPYDELILAMIHVYCQIRDNGVDLPHFQVPEGIRGHLALETLFLLFVGCIYSRTGKEYALEDCAWVHKRLTNAFTTHKYYSLALSWQLLYSGIQPEAQVVFDRLLEQYFLDADVPAHQKKAVEELLKKLGPNAVTGKAAAFDVRPARVLGSILNDNRPEILNFYAERKMKAESLGYFFRHLDLRRLENAFQEKSELPLLKNLVTSVGQIQSYDMPAPNLVYHYIELLEQMHYPSKDVDRVGLQRHLDNILSALSILRQSHDSSHRPLLEVISQGLVDLISGGLFRGQDSVKEAFLRAFITKRHILVLPPHRLPEAIRKLSQSL
jgi:hypothetical protein